MSQADVATLPRQASNSAVAPLASSPQNGVGRAAARVNASAAAASAAATNAPKPPADDRFAFERAHFSRAEFNAERFINVASRRAPLSQVHKDLCDYLRHVQHSMVELINDEYTDFVTLSSNLATLKESIENVATKVNDGWSAFGSATEVIQRTSQILTQKIEQVNESRHRQIAMRNMISLVQSIDALSDCLTHRPSDLSQKWYTRFIHSVVNVELWLSRIGDGAIAADVTRAKEACVAKAKELVVADLVADLRGECCCIKHIHVVLFMLRMTESGVKQVAHVYVQNAMELDENANDIAKLQQVFDIVMKLYNQWTKKCKAHNQLTIDVERFLGECLLNYVLEYLDKDMAVLCIPSVPALFRQAYATMTEFARAFPHIKQHEFFLKGLDDRFNVVLYVKRLWTPIDEELLARTANTHVQWHYNTALPDRHPLDASATVLAAIARLFDPDVFLPVVADHTWQMCTQLINRHTKWIDACLAAEPSEVVDELSGAVSVAERWPDLVALHSGSQKFDSDLFDVCLRLVFPHFQTIGADAVPFRQYLSSYSGQLEAKRAAIRRRLLRDAIDAAVKPLAGYVAAVPKRYRWTKRPMPTEHSKALDEAMETPKKLADAATARLWGEEHIAALRSDVVCGISEHFLKSAQQVLESVQMTGSSLQRFKRKVTPANEAAGAGGGDTDEAKIRRQLHIDAEKMREIADAAGVSTETLDAFIAQLAQETAA